MTMTMTLVISRVFAAIGYDPATRQMKVRFRDGNVRVHRRVPEFVYEQFIASPRKAQYYRLHVVDRYPDGSRASEDHSED